MRFIIFLVFTFCFLSHADLRPGNTGGGSSGFSNPMTTGGDIIYGGASGVATRLANGTAGYHLQSNGTTLAPSWAAPFAMASNVYLTGNGTNLIGWDASGYNSILVGNAGTKQTNVASTIDFYTTGSITLDPANGNVNILGNGTTIPGIIRFHDNGADTVVSVKANATTSANYDFIFPQAQGAAGTALINSDGAGQLIYQQVYDLDITVTAAGTTGNRTINKPGGTVNFAAAATSITVTNSLVDTSTLVFVQRQTLDSTCTSFTAVPGSGSFVITANAGCNAETSVAFNIIK